MVLLLTTNVHLQLLIIINFYIKVHEKKSKIKECVCAVVVKRDDMLFKLSIFINYLTYFINYFFFVDQRNKKEKHTHTLFKV